MKKVITTEKLPIKMWLDDIETDTLSQAKDLANLPIAYKHIAIMPDAHLGYGMPIGAILASKEAVVPNAVGVDIGCGMCSLRTSLDALDTETLKKIMSVIRKTVPVGFKHHKEQQLEEWMPATGENMPVAKKEYNNARYQVGTLGGGNHFIEIQQGSDGHVWIMIHSGSRNIGYKVAQHYHKLAVEMRDQTGSTVPKDLSFLPLDTPEAELYLDEMNYCIQFALQNRKLMMERVKKAFEDVIGNIEFDSFINKPHNFAAWETHFREEVIVHRKGATRARKGELGMIPGSQGSFSYLVKGKGNPESFESCSHGAGRVMSRSKARKTLSVRDETNHLKSLGVIHSIRSKRDLDEAPGSYKDIEQVMKNQQDLVDIYIRLNPLAVIKG